MSVSGSGNGLKCDGNVLSLSQPVVVSPPLSPEYQRAVSIRRAAANAVSSNPFAAPFKSILIQLKAKRGMIDSACSCTSDAFRSFNPSLTPLQWPDAIAPGTDGVSIVTGIDTGTAAGSGSGGGGGGGGGGAVRSVPPEADVTGSRSSLPERLVWAQLPPPALFGSPITSVRAPTATTTVGRSTRNGGGAHSPPAADVGTGGTAEKWSFDRFVLYSGGGNSYDTSNSSDADRYRVYCELHTSVQAKQQHFLSALNTLYSESKSVRPNLDGESQVSGYHVLRLMRSVRVRINRTFGPKAFTADGAFNPTAAAATATTTASAGSVGSGASAVCVSAGSVPASGEALSRVLRSRLTARAKPTTPAQTPPPPPPPAQPLPSADSKSLITASVAVSVTPTGGGGGGTSESVSGADGYHSGSGSYRCACDAFEWASDPAITIAGAASHDRLQHLTEELRADAMRVREQWFAAMNQTNQTPSPSGAGASPQTDSKRNAKRKSSPAAGGGGGGASGGGGGGGTNRSLPATAKHGLIYWLYSHFEYPYPSDDVKEIVATRIGITSQQVQYWLINNRVRMWRSLMDRAEDSLSAGGVGSGGGGSGRSRPVKKHKSE